MANETPRKIGQFELRSVLGRGGMATVWRAYQPSLDRDVAIKLMAAQFSEDENFTKRFNQEARSIARLRHPNILAIYEYGQQDGQPYIVTELLDGGTLREYMSQKQLDLRETSRILHQIADALDYAHAQGMVHRDIKPSNILMGTQRVLGDRAVLSDFGIVKLLSSTNITQTGVGIGTPEYMSPEQAAGEPLDGRSDEYSLGIVLYEMLTGVTPYKADTPLAVLMGHVNRPLPDPRTFNPQLPEEIVQVLNKALAKYPQERYDSAGAFSEAFQHAVAVNTPGGLTPLPPANPFSAPTDNQPPGAMNSLSRQSTNQGFISTAQAYDYAMQQERQGNRQAAFETFTDIQRREPNYRDVSNKLKDYEAQHFQYSGNHTLFRPVVAPRNEEATKALEVGPLKSPTVSSPYVPNDPTSSGAVLGTSTNPTPVDAATMALPSSVGVQQPAAIPSALPATPVVPKPAAAGSGRFIGIGIGALVLLAVIIGAVILLTGGKKDPVSTPVAAISVTAANTQGASAGPSAVATTVISTAAADVTAQPPPPTALPTTVPEKADPAKTLAAPIVAQIYSKDGNLKDGVAKLLDLVKSNKDSWFARRELGRAYYWYVRDQGGVQYLKEATQLNSQDALSYAYLAIAYADNFDDANAQTAVRSALNLDPNSAEVRAASAITLIRGDSKQARDEITKALAIDSDNLLVNYAAWSVYQASNDFGTALNYLNKVIDKYPTFASLAYSKGYHYDRSGNSADALTWYNNALKIDPDFPLAHTGLGQAARLKGDFQTAISEYQKSIKVYSNDVNAHIGLGYSLDAVQKPQEAVQEFLKAISLDKNNPEAYNGLAGVYLEQAKASPDQGVKTSNINLALTQVEQALSLAPDYADAYYHRGAAYFLNKEYSKAETAFKKAVELDGKNALYYYSLGANYVQMGDKQSAKLNLQKAIDLEPDFQAAKDLLKAIGG